MSHRRMPTIPLPEAAYEASANALAVRLFGNHRPPQSNPTMADVAAALGDLAKAQAAFVKDQTKFVADVRGDVTALQNLTETLSSQVAAARVGGGGATGAAGDDAPWSPQQHRAAMKSLHKFLRAGGFNFQGPYAASRTDSNPDGGFLVPDEVDRAVTRLVRDFSPMRQLAEVVTIRGGVFKRHKWVTGAATGWVSEAATRPETDMSKLTELAFPAMEQYCMPGVSQNLLDDSNPSIADQVALEVRDAFALQEGNAFAVGNGVLMPRGVLNYTTTLTPNVWGEIQYIKTGNGSGFIASRSLSE